MSDIFLRLWHRRQSDCRSCWRDERDGMKKKVDVSLSIGCLMYIFQLHNGWNPLMMLMMMMMRINWRKQLSKENWWMNKSSWQSRHRLSYGKIEEIDWNLINLRHHRQDLRVYFSSIAAFFNMSCLLVMSDSVIEWVSKECEAL